MHPRALRPLLRLSLAALPWLAAMLAQPLSATPAYVTIGTGALNGVYYPTGGAICRLLNDDSSNHGLHCTVQSTSGSIANLAALAKGDIQLALVQSDVLYHAAHGSGPFAGQTPNDQLRSLLRLHKESLTLLASATSNISTLADIEGKRVDLGAPNSGDRVTSRALLDAMGWQATDFTLPPVASPGNRLEGLCNGTLDAAFLVAGHPNQGIGDLTGRCQARLIPIEGEQVDKLLKQYPYYERSRIGANLYPGQTSSVATFAVTAELVAEASLPEDQVRTLRDVLSRNLKQFTRLHPALTTLTPESMQAGDVLPLHPGMLDAAPTLLPDALAPSGAEATSEALPTAPSAPTSAATPLEGAAVLPEQPAGATLPANSDAVTTGQAPALTTLPTPTEADITQGSQPDAAGIATPSAAKSTAPTEAPAPGNPSGASPLTGDTPAPAQ
ncbi:TAXI family TRAP transporter solute-binding subunit [Aeromonas rivipollensis]|uniref:TAXI family TRAP transporter solute-binding subunit n=1 Tax=Aeromonas rivipollensis TaxID=948519 RepID=UPI001F17A320|nr:TAXI family TRAP transporter solute-binding subunit [Aeromonas rivipollensis]MCE9956283.1 TAXI family TRAP transporter solute-binding subunit [Aeromonas rivipollensis]